MSAASSSRISVVTKGVLVCYYQIVCKISLQGSFAAQLAEAAFLLAGSCRPDAFKTPLNFIAEAPA